MFKKLSNYFKRLRQRPERLEHRSESERKRPIYPTIILEDSFVLVGTKGDAIFKIRFEVPIPLLDTSENKEKIERMKKAADTMFRPMVTALKYYLCGLHNDSSPERFLIGRENLISAIEECAVIQLQYARDAENNR